MDSGSIINRVECDACSDRDWEWDSDADSDLDTDSDDNADNDLDCVSTRFDRQMQV